MSGAVVLPSWLLALRKAEITDRVRTDLRSRDNTLLGLSSAEAAAAIGGGQADFDTPTGDFSPDDRALLYAHLNQKGHLEELVEAFGQYFADSEPRNPIVVDVGCGPFTGGLALAATLGDDASFDYVGIDRAESMRRLGERLARSDLVPGHVTRRWASAIQNVAWDTRPGWRETIVICSYLLASPTLDVPTMVDDLDALLGRLGHGAVTLLYTNSVRDGANRLYPLFQAKLADVGFGEAVADGPGEILVERWTGKRVRPLRYALFRRPRRRTLAVGGA